MMGDPCPQAAATRRSLSRVAWMCLRPAAIISYAITPANFQTQKGSDPSCGKLRTCGDNTWTAPTIGGNPGESGK